MSTQNDLPTGCNTDGGPADGPALDDDGPNTDGCDRIGRRPFVKGLGAAAAASVALGLDDGPVGNAQAFPPALLPAAAAVGVIAYGEFVSGPDEEEVADALDWQMAVNEFTRAREDQLMVSETMASLKRDVQLVENKAREEAIFQIYEQGVDNGSEADATAAAEAAINDAYAVVERSILTSWNIRIARAKSILQNFVDGRDTYGRWREDYHDETVRGGSYTDSIDDNSTSSFIIEGNGGHLLSDVSHTLLDGDTLEYSVSASEDTGDTTVAFDPVEWSSLYADSSYGDSGFVDQLWFVKPDPADFDTTEEPLDVSYTQSKVLDASEWGPLMDDLYDLHGDVMAEVSSMVDTYYQPAADGEIDLHNLIGPAHLSDTASTAEDYQEAAMALRAMGYPMSDQVCTVSIADPDDLDEDGDPVTHERTGRLSWTAHSGNMLTVGSELNPDNIVGSVFFAYNEPQDDGSTVGQTRELSRPFTVESAEGASGVSFEDRTLVEAESTLTNEEIQELFQEHYEANQEAKENVHDTATGGGGGWSGLSTTDKGIVAVVAAAILGLVTR